jgi:hypothetical protein
VAFTSHHLQNCLCAHGWAVLLGCVSKCMLKPRFGLMSYKVSLRLDLGPCVLPDFELVFQTNK